MGELRIDYVLISEIRPFPHNARSHPPKQVDQIVASIQANGWAAPIVIDETGEIICGHGRWLGARKLGLATVPVVRLEGLSDLQKRSLRLADNKIAQNAAWDPELLKIEIEAILAVEDTFDFDQVGFATAEVDRIRFDRDREDEEPTPKPPAIAVSRQGDIWLLGNDHRLGCGDARDEVFLRQVVGDRPVDMAFLDPPYNLRLGGVAVAKGSHREFAFASGEMTAEAFRAFLVEGLGACARVSKDGAVHFICADHRHVEDFCAALNAVYSQRLTIAIWRKSNAGMGGLYRNQYEMVFVMKVGDGAYFNAVELGKHGRNRTNVWDYDSVNTFRKSRRGDLDLHPTVKPIGLVGDAILDCTKPGDLVLDAYSGSGTTLLGCLRSGRRFRGLDIDPAYVDLALHRWADRTGGRVVLETTGETFEAVAAARAGDRA